jgi:hypothetical protein
MALNPSSSTGWDRDGAKRDAWNWKISIVAVALSVAFLVVALVARFH